MKLFFIWQTESKGYDTYSDMVVCAESEEEAKKIHPYWPEPWPSKMFGWHCWCWSPEDVNVKFLGEAAEGIEKGIVCASFHAG